MTEVGLRLRVYKANERYIDTESERVVVVMMEILVCPAGLFSTVSFTCRVTAIRLTYTLLVASLPRLKRTRRKRRALGDGNESCTLFSVTRVYSSHRTCHRHLLTHVFAP